MKELIKEEQNNVFFLSQDKYLVNYKGLLFLSGFKEGEDSIREILRRLEERKKIDFEEIYGNYYLEITNSKTKEQFIFADNSGIFKLYKRGERFSTRFLSLVSPEMEIDKFSVVEFLNFGFVYEDRTFFKEISKVDSRYYYHKTDGHWEKKDKGLSTLNTPSNTNFDDFFKDLTFALQDRKTSLDLTGGFDSRLIYSYFVANNVKAELAISGQKGNEDIVIAEKLAVIGGYEFYPTYHSSDTVDEKSIRGIFEITDAQMDVVDFHRNHQLINERKNRGSQVHISGAGGELYKDFWWLQDFPNYNKKTADIAKLYDLRIKNRSFNPKVLAKKYKEEAEHLDSKILDDLKAYIQPTNTQTYDNIYYRYKMAGNAGSYITSTNQYLQSYTPLLERELVKIGYNLERKKRFFNLFHKQLITKNSPEIAKVRTTEGISCSNKPTALLSDIFFYTIDKGKRISKIILRKMTKKTYFQESPTNSKVVDKWMDSPTYKQAVKHLQNKGILSTNINTEDFPKNLAGRFTTLSMLLEYMDNQKD